MRVAEETRLEVQTQKLTARARARARARACGGGRVHTHTHVLARIKLSSRLRCPAGLKSLANSPKVKFKSMLHLLRDHFPRCFLQSNLKCWNKGVFATSIFKKDLTS